MTTTAITQSAQLELVEVKDGPRIESRVLAESMGNTHRPTVALIDKYRDVLERFGHVTFKKAVGERKQGGGKAERIALLGSAHETEKFVRQGCVQCQVEAYPSLVSGYEAGKRQNRVAFRID